VLHLNTPYCGGEGLRRCWRNRLNFEVNEAMSVTVLFKDTSTNKTTSLEYEMGAVIPELGNYIVSPFNANRIALVSEVTGDGNRNPLSILCAEE
jgi:hypothetical protein